jgi:hypothetical protein
MGIIIVLMCAGLCTGIVAHLKGYSRWAWFFSGVLGIFIVFFIPRAKPDEEDLHRMWDGRAGILAVIQWAAAIGLWASPSAQQQLYFLLQ